MEVIIIPPTVKPETLKTLQELISLDKDFENHLINILKLRKKNFIVYKIAIDKLNSL